MITLDLIQGLLIVTTIHFLAAASPGPDFVLVSQQTLSHGKKTGFLCSVGIALGLSVHIIYSVLGLAAVIAHSEFWLWAIKIFGGCYLIYIGINGLKAKKSNPRENNDTVHSQECVTNNTVQHSTASIIGKGFLCNALNPKAPIYFVSLFTLVLSPDLPISHLVIYGVWMMLIQLIWFSSVVFLLSRPSINKKFQQMGHWVDRVMGAAMIVLGIKVLMSKVN